jgi:hypothetical protein
MPRACRRCRCRPAPSFRARPSHCPRSCRFSRPAARNTWCGHRAAAPLDCAHLRALFADARRSRAAASEGNPRHPHGVHRRQPAAGRVPLLGVRGGNRGHGARASPPPPPWLSVGRIAAAPGGTRAARGAHGTRAVRRARERAEGSRLGRLGATGHCRLTTAARGRVLRTHSHHPLPPHARRGEPSAARPASALGPRYFARPAVAFAPRCRALPHARLTPGARRPAQNIEAQDQYRSTPLVVTANAEVVEVRAAKQLATSELA